MSRIPFREQELILNYLISQKILDAYPWYDAVWLCKYVAAKKMINHMRPDLVNDFVNAFNRLRTRPDFAVRKLDRVFDDEVMEKILETIKTLPADALESHEVAGFGRLVAHNHPFFTDLQRSIQPLVSELVGEIVEPSYNFLSLYSQFGVCDPHMDQPNAKWTLDVCLDQSVTWPIHFSQVVPWPEDFSCREDDWRTCVKQSPDLQFTSYHLQRNEAVLFSGSSQWHYRDSLENVAIGGFCNLLFFHFLPVGMSEIVRPENWPQMFSIPELAAVVGERS